MNVNPVKSYIYSNMQNKASVKSTVGQDLTVTGSIDKNNRLADNPDKHASADNSNVSLFGDDGLNFWDFLDVINPLQHIPVISTIYRQITGDEIGAAAKVIGGAIYGGGIGAAFQAADVALDSFTGKDLGEHTVAFLDNAQDSAKQTTANPALAKIDPHYTNPVKTAMLYRAQLLEKSAKEAQPPPPQEIVTASADTVIQSQENKFFPLERQKKARMFSLDPSMFSKMSET